MVFKMKVSPVQPWSYFLCCSLCMIHIIHGWATLTLLLLLLRRHYSPMQTPASLMDFSESDVFWPLFPVFNFASINICLHTVPPSVFWSSYQSTSLGIIIKHLTYFSFTIHSINMANPIQLTWPKVLVKEWKGNCYHHQQNKTFQLKITVSTTKSNRLVQGYAMKTNYSFTCSVTSCHVSVLVWLGWAYIQ